MSLSNSELALLSAVLAGNNLLESVCCGATKLLSSEGMDEEDEEPKMEPPKPPGFAVARFLSRSASHVRI